MARKRSIKPEFFEDTTLAEVSRDARLLYIGLWCFMDCQGLTEADPRLLKRNIYPYDDEISPAFVDLLVEELCRVDRLRRVEFEGKRYLYAPKFTKHQKIYADDTPKHLLPDEILRKSSAREKPLGPEKNFSEPRETSRGREKPLGPEPSLPLPLSLQTSASAFSSKNEVTTTSDAPALGITPAPRVDNFYVPPVKRILPFSLPMTRASPAELETKRLEALAWCRAQQQGERSQA